MNDIQEMMLEAEQAPYGLFAQGDMVEIFENYKASNIGSFVEAELVDLNTLNDKNKHWLTFLTEDGFEIPANKKNVLNLGRGTVGAHNRIIKHYRNSLKTTPLKITNVVFDTKERITTKTPVGPIKPNEEFEIEYDWKPLIGSRKPLRCNAMIMAEPVWSKRLDKAIYPWDED